MFTRRHYVWLASVGRDMRHQAKQVTPNPLVLEAVDLAIGILADALEAESEAFDRDLFIRNIRNPQDIPALS
jgi:hypothetical protein